MKIVRYKTHGNPPDVVQVVDGEPEPVGDDDVLIDVEASPIRFQDLYTLRGLPGFKRHLPEVPGGIGIGRITVAGRNVTHLTPGDRVYLRQASGAWQEKTSVPANGLHRAPNEGDPIQLAFLNSNLITAYGLLKYVVDLETGDWVLHDAANSNCGHYIIRLAKLWGLRTVSVVRRPVSIDELRALGADAVVVDGPDLARKVATATGNAQIKLALDMVAGSLTGRLAECVAKGGTIANFGQVSGQPLQVPSHMMLFKQLTITGFLTLSSMARKGCTYDDMGGIYDELAGLVNRGQLPSKIAGVYPFERVSEALRHFARGEREGKIVLVPRL